MLLQDLPDPNLIIIPSRSYKITPSSRLLSPSCSGICDVRKFNGLREVLQSMYIGYMQSEHREDVVIYIDGSKGDDGVSFVTIGFYKTYKTWSKHLQVQTQCLPLICKLSVLHWQH